MAEYKAIHGTLVENKTSDPLAAGIAGGSWSTGGALNRGNSVFIVGAGTTNTAAIAAGGNVGGPPYTDVTNTESYNGSSWTEVNDLNTARNSSSGTPSAPYASALYHGGGPVGITSNESWDGTSWSETGDLNTARTNHMGAGASNTSAITAGGETTPRPPAQSANAETWDGSSWTEVGNINDTRRHAPGLGTATAALLVGGDNDPGLSDAVEEWNGSSWTEIAEINTARAYTMAVGTTTEGLIAGGRTPPKTAATESWNGSSWTEISDLATARAGFTGSGVATSNLFAGGETATAYTTAVEEFNTAGATDTLQNDGQVFYRSDTGDFKITLKQFGTGAWSSGGNMPAHQTLMGSFGTQTATTTGGSTSATAYTADAFSYNGVAWSEIAEINTLRNQATGFGVQTLGLIAAGYTDTSPAGARAVVENWDGSSWSEVADLSSNRTNAGSAGTYTAGLVFAGSVPPVTAVNESWNGSAWTEVGDVNTARHRSQGQAIGTQTAAMLVGGEGFPGITEVWDGSSWTEVSDLNTSRHLGGGSGITTSAVVSSGRVGAPGYAPNNSGETWDGTSWTEVANVSSARAYMSATGTGSGNSNSQSMIFGGATSGSTANTSATEEWNIPESISNLTITD